MSTLRGRYRLASDDIVCEEFDGEMVILNLGTGHYFALNHSASVLLNGLLQGHAVENLASLAGAGFSAEEALAFFSELLAQGLVTADGSQPPAALDSLLPTAAGRLTEKPMLEIHSDLADLIIADPIHDSDEASGWPVLRAA